MPKPENIGLIANLDAAISRLAEVSLEHSDWEFPFRPFLWEVESQGAFSSEKLFQFQAVSEAEFLEACRSRAIATWTPVLPERRLSRIVWAIDA
jgi:hypothetical protein